MKPFASAADDALFEATDGRVFQVHLMLSRRLEQPPLPRPASGRTERERARWVLRPANEEYCTLSIMISLNRTAEVKFPVSPFERSRKRQAGARAVWVAEGEPRPSTEDSRGSCVPEQCGPRKG